MHGDSADDSPPSPTDEPEAEQPPTSVTGPTGSRAAMLCALLALLLLVPFVGSRNPTNPDEPREIEIARESAHGDWTVVPEINGKPFLEHPPLQYWLAAAIMNIVGEPSAGAARMASVLFGVLTILATWMAAEALLGKGTGIVAALLLLGTPYLFTRFRICLSDTGLTAFITLSLALFFRAHVRGSRVDAVLAGVASGLAFLCKGLLGYGIPAVAGLAYLAVRRDLRAILRLRLWLTVIVGLAVALPWVLALYRLEGTEGLHKFFIWNHFGRFGQDADHARPFWFYTGVVVAALPLSLLALAGALAKWPSSSRRQTARLAGLCWFVAPFLVLSLASGKRSIYLLPLYPGLAILGAAALHASDGGGLGPRLRGLVRGTMAALEWITLTALLPGGRSTTRRILAVGVVLCLATATIDAQVVRRLDGSEDGRELVLEADRLAAGRPLVLFRVGQGDIGHFTFHLRRKLPVAWQEEHLLELTGPATAVVVGQTRDFDRARRAGALSEATLARLRPIAEGSVDRQPCTVYEWVPEATEPVRAPGPGGGR